jgi:hypothetical protein
MKVVLSLSSKGGGTTTIYDTGVAAAAGKRGVGMITIVIVRRRGGGRGDSGRCGGVTYLEYFGTYLGYLSTDPMSQHSDTHFQLIPD